MMDIDGYVNKDNLYRLISKIRRNPENVVDDKTCCIITDAISKMIQSDVQPVKRGNWEYRGSGSPEFTFRCSCCKNIASNEYSYCPNCGARMDGDTE